MQEECIPIESSPNALIIRQIPLSALSFLLSAFNVKPLHL